MGCTDNTLSRNTVSASGVFGIHLQGSTGNSLTGNDLSDNTTGVRLMGCQSNAITGNEVKNSGTGIDLQGSARNCVSGNTLVRNKNYGLYFYNASENTVDNNTISGNGCGLYFWNANRNKVFNNNFVDNGSQARVSTSSGNVFNLPRPVGGNYWSDWTGPDNNNDGFVDNPYVLARCYRVFCGQDNLPWAKPSGWRSSEPPFTVIDLSGTPAETAGMSPMSG